MRDKEIQRYMDKEFTEKAWLEMNRVLDREMPVTKKKRRAAVWFWMAAGILLLLSSGILLWAKESSSPQDEFKEKPIASNIQENRVAANSAKSAISPASTAPPFTGKKITSAGKVKTNNRPNSRTQNTDAPINTFISVNDPVGSSPRFNDLLEDEKTMDSSLETLPATEFVQVDEAPFTSRTVRSIRKIRTLTLYLKEPSTNDYAFSKNDIDLPWGSKPSRVDLFLYANGQTEGFSALKGYEAGIAMSKRLAHSKWSLSMGSGFQSEIRTLEVNTNSYFNFTVVDSSIPTTTEINAQVFDNFNYDPDDATSSPVNGFEDAAQSSGSSNLNVQLYYLAFPIKVSYKLTPRFGLNTGITPSIYLSGKITNRENYISPSGKLALDNTNYAGAADLTTPIPIANNRFFYFTSKAIAPAAIKKWKFPVHIGLDYQITRHFGTTLDYQVALGSLTDRNYISTGNQRFRLGGYWKF